MMSKRQSYYIQTDLIVLLVLFMTVSLLAIYNAQQLEQYAGKNFVIQQVVWFIVGIGILAVIQLVDLEQLYKASTYIYIISVSLLVILYFSPTSIAPIVNNAKSWFNLRSEERRVGKECKSRLW